MRFVMLACTAIFTMTLSNLSYSQTDSLKRYSYFINGLTYPTTFIGVNHDQATGFFIKKNNKNIFFTADHVFTGCNYQLQKESSPDFMILWFHDLSGEFVYGGASILQLQKIRDSAICRSYIANPDLISYNYLDTFSIFSLNKSVFKKKIPKQRGQLMIYGFPIVNNISNKGYEGATRPASALSLMDYDIKEFEKIYDSNVLVTDSMNYHIAPKNFIVTDSLQGYSGSPVFVRNEKKSTWECIGVFAAIDAVHNEFYVVKAKNILDKLR